MTNNRMNFPRRKKLLLKTHTLFDSSASGPPAVSYNDEELDSQMVPVSLQPASPNSLVIQALIQQVCIHMEQDGKKRKMLYSAICKILNQHKFLGLDFSLDELWPLKQKFCGVLSSFFRQVHKEISSQGFGSCTSLSIRNVFDYVRTDYGNYSSRYQQSFEELETIDKGGFGVVCKARNKVDGIVYAVKKIKFMYTNDVEFKKVLREVRSFALLKHQNIVNYNNSWLETNIVTGSTVYRASSDSESYSGDSELQFSNNSFKTKSNETDSISPVLNLSSETSVNDDGDSSQKKSYLASLLVDSLSTPVKVESHSVVIDSEVCILHQNIVIKEGYQDCVFKTSQENIEQSSEISGAKFSFLSELNCCEPSFSDKQVIQNDEYEIKNGDSLCHSVSQQTDETGDHSHKPPSRRRRHSSGATCSMCDPISEGKDISHPRSYERVNSLDLDPKRCTELVPKKADVKWDISDLNVMAVLYIQMELCDSSLRDWLDKRGEMPFSFSKYDVIFGDALRIFKQIVQGVEHIHSKSIIHRDLKPKNIFMCCDGLVKIGDFGLAALCTQTDDAEFFHTRCSCSHTQGLGTAPYSAPEQRKDNIYDNKVDIYSLGIILIELLHQYQTRMEFSSTIEKILEGSIPIEFVDVWPKEIVNLIRELTHGNPQKRPEAKEVLSYLQRFQVSEPLAISSSLEDMENKESEAALENSRLRAQICALKRQLKEKDETIKEKDETIKDLQLKLLYSSNCDSFV